MSQSFEVCFVPHPSTPSPESASSFEHVPRISFESLDSVCRRTDLTFVGDAPIQPCTTLPYNMKEESIPGRARGPGLSQTRQGQRAEGSRRGQGSDPRSGVKGVAHLLDHFSTSPYRPSSALAISSLSRCSLSLVALSLSLSLSLSLRSLPTSLLSLSSRSPRSLLLALSSVLSSLLSFPLFSSRLALLLAVPFPLFSRRSLLSLSPRFPLFSLAASHRWRASAQRRWSSSSRSC